jgi:hypothetical protein
MSRHQAAESAAVNASGEIVTGGSTSSDRGRTIHRERFRFAVIALLALGIASLGVAIGLSTGGRTTSSPGDWSTFQPTEGGLTGAQEIADYVAPYYRATASSQLAVVTAVNLNDPSHPVQVAVPASGASAGSSPAASSSLLPLPATSTIVYNLCGVGGHDCSIGVGQPSAARMLLLKREALELALYTFKYISGVSYVVALLPPGRSSHGCSGICPQPHSPVKITPLNVGIFFDSQELKPWLQRPLSYTFPEPLPPTVAEMPGASEAELVSLITAHGLFLEHVEQGQDGSSVVLLTPLPPS